MKKCFYCAIDKERIIFENDLVVVVAPVVPKSDGHSLLLIKRHIADFQEATDEEMAAIIQLLAERQKQLLANDVSIKKINIRANLCLPSEKIVNHCNLHIIPRRNNDGLSEIGD